MPANQEQGNVCNWPLGQQLQPLATFLLEGLQKQMARDRHSNDHISRAASLSQSLPVIANALNGSASLAMLTVSTYGS